MSDEHSLLLTNSFIHPASHHWCQSIGNLVKVLLIQDVNNCYVITNFVSFQASYMKGLDIYLIGCYVFVFFAIVEYALLHFKTIKLGWGKNKVFTNTNVSVDSLSVSSFEYTCITIII